MNENRCIYIEIYLYTYMYIMCVYIYIDIDCGESIQGRSFVNPGFTFLEATFSIQRNREADELRELSRFMIKY